MGSNCQQCLPPVLLLQNEDAYLIIISAMFSEIGVAKFPPDYLRHRVIMFIFPPTHGKKVVQEGVNH